MQVYASPLNGTIHKLILVGVHSAVRRIVKNVQEEREKRRPRNCREYNTWNIYKSNETE